MHGFLWESKVELTAVILSRHTRATSSRNKGLFHYLAADGGSVSSQGFVWRAPRSMQNSHLTIRPRVALEKENAHIEQSSGIYQEDS